MGYAIETDVEKRTGKAYASTGTEPLSSAISDWIDQITEDIDAALDRAGYVTPITVADNPRSYKILTRLCAMAVAAEAERSVYWEESDGNITPNRIKRWEKIYDSSLIAYTGVDSKGDWTGEPTKRLPDATFKTVGTQLARSYGQQNETEINTVRRFEVGKKH